MMRESICPNQANINTQTPEDVSGWPQEDRGCSACKVGKDQGKEESRLTARGLLLFFILIF